MSEPLTRLVISQETYQAVVHEIVPSAKKLLWLGLGLFPEGLQDFDLVSAHKD